jgi:hypothetical protein
MVGRFIIASPLVTLALTLNGAKLDNAAGFVLIGCSLFGLILWSFQWERFKDWKHERWVKNQQNASL